MATNTMASNDFISILAQKIQKKKNINNFTRTDFETGVGEKIISPDIVRVHKNIHLSKSMVGPSIKWILSKIVWGSIKMTSITLFRIYKYLVKLIDKYFVFILEVFIRILMVFLINSKSLLLKYINNKNYRQTKFEKKYSDTDIAYITLSLQEREKITLSEIQETYDLSYHYALEVKKMMKDKLKALTLVTEDQKQILK